LEAPLVKSDYLLHINRYGTIKVCSVVLTTVMVTSVAHAFL